MSKKVLVISSSMRRNSNSDILADAFIEGARQAGNAVEKISLRGKTIGFCLGCLACQKTKRCVIKDDAQEIVKKMKAADVIAFATPIYYYEMSGQLKTMLDRANPLFPSDYCFRKVYLLAAAAEDEETTITNTANGIKGWVDCFDKATFAGYLFCGGVTEAGDIKGNPKLNEAEMLGASV